MSAFVSTCKLRLSTPDGFLTVHHRCATRNPIYTTTTTTITLTSCLPFTAAVPSVPTMPARIDPLEVREQVKLLYFANGRNLQLAADAAGVPYRRAQKWLQRGDWDQLPPAKQLNAVSQRVSEVVDHVATELAHARHTSTLGLARFSARAAQAASEHPKPLEIARKVRDAAAVHATLWPEVQRQEILSLELLSGRIEIKDAETGETPRETPEKDL